MDSNVRIESGGLGVVAFDACPPGIFFAAAGLQMR
jgi:hypothetical protein